MFETTATLAFLSLGWQEFLLIGGVAILLFGRRLPEVGRSLGRGIVELKKGLQGIGEEIEATGQAQTGQSNSKTEKS